MKGIILLNGEPYYKAINAENAVVYCCDGAYAWAKGRIKIDRNIGDFDSLNQTPYPPPEEIYPAEKDFTDGEIALLKMLSEGVDEIEFYGFGGGREDHFLGNLQLLYRAYSAGIKCRAYTEKSVMFPAGGKILFGEYKNKTVSVLPFGGALNIIDSEGLKYAYPERIGYGECRGLSNIVLSENAYLKVDGCALVIINIYPV